MRKSYEQSKSVWMDTAKVPLESSLGDRVSANVCIVGAGIAGLTTADGRFSILMPHPERVFRTVQMSWHPDEWKEDSPWMRMFRNARVWVG